MPAATDKRQADTSDQSLNSFKSKSTLTVGGKTYTYFRIAEAEKNGLKGVSTLPHSMKVVLENLLRFEDGRTVTKADIQAIADMAARPAPPSTRSPTARPAC